MRRIALVLILLSLLAAASCGEIAPSGSTGASSQTPSLSVTIASTASQATATPSPTSTPDPVSVQQELLYQVSLTFLAENDAEALRVVQTMEYAQGATPKTMCGPLAFAILSQAGFVSKYIDLHDFWQLNPRVDGDLLERTFPPQHFQRLNVAQPINSVDYSQFPLQAGDLLYLYQGREGDYEHVLAVTRVDEAGRAYSVTNNYTGQGFVIQEYMLYDPANPGQGIFYAWTDPANANLGLTGFGGFDLWRPVALPFHADGGDPLLSAGIDAAIAESGGDWYIAIQAPERTLLYSRRGNVPIQVEAIAHLPIAMLFLRSLEESGIVSITDYLGSTGDYEASLRQLLYQMLVQGNSQAEKDLIVATARHGLSINDTLQTWGLTGTNIYHHRSTAEDMVNLMEGLHQREMVSDESAGIIFEWMDVAAGENNDPLKVLAPEGYLVHTKHLVLYGQYPVMATLASVENSAGAFFIAIFGYQNQRRPTNPATQAQTYEKIIQSLWQYITTNAQSQP